jgi:hypothetical protein
MDPLLVSHLFSTALGARAEEESRDGQRRLGSLLGLGLIVALGGCVFTVPGAGEQPSASIPSETPIFDLSLSTSGEPTGRSVMQDLAPNACDLVPSDQSAANSCRNGIQDGTETDIDCGGPSCPPCLPSQECLLPRDCTSLLCWFDRCAL